MYLCEVSGECGEGFGGYVCSNVCGFVDVCGSIEGGDVWRVFLCKVPVYACDCFCGGCGCVSAGVSVGLWMDCMCVWGYSYAGEVDVSLGV